MNFGTICRTGQRSRRDEFSIPNARSITPGLYIERIHGERPRAPLAEGEAGRFSAAILEAWRRGPDARIRAAFGVE